MSLSKKQHEGFAQFFEQPTRESLRALIKENIGETDYLDFKEQWISDQKLAKHILAMSNSGGGAVIVGIKENDDGSMTPVGIDNFTDKEKISKGLSKYLPENVSWESYEFSYKDSEYEAIKGKKFQVVLVEYDPQYIPFLCLKASDGLKENTVYVRRGTSTTEATHGDLQKIINARIETGYSSKHILDLSEHLQQLKELYKAKGKNNHMGAVIRKTMMMINGDKLNDYDIFIDELIDRKKSRIIKELAL